MSQNNINTLTLSRPWPVDEIRQSRVHSAMRLLGMTNRELAGLSQIQVTNLNNLISGRWRSPEAESKVAYILGQDSSYLFPYRTREDLVEMAIAAKEEKEAIAQRRKENFARLGIAV